MCKVFRKVLFLLIGVTSPQPRPRLWATPQGRAASDLDHPRATWRAPKSRRTALTVQHLSWRTASVSNADDTRNTAGVLSRVSRSVSWARQINALPTELPWSAGSIRGSLLFLTHIHNSYCSYTAVTRYYFICRWRECTLFNFNVRPPWRSFECFA